jgi:hypothetical protein
VIGARPTAAPRIQVRLSSQCHARYTALAYHNSLLALQRRWLSSSIANFIGHPEASVTSDHPDDGGTTSARGRVTLSDGDVIMGISFPEDGTLIPVSTTGKDGSLVPASTTLLSGNPLITETDITSTLASSTSSSLQAIPTSSSASIAATSDGSFDGISLQLASVYATVFALLAACLAL